jgi:hypothetical protein
MVKEINSQFYSLAIVTILFLIKLNNCYIVLPFKLQTLNGLNNLTTMIENTMENRLIITLSIGESKEQVDFYASMNEYIYFLEEGSCLSNTSRSYHFLTSRSFIFLKQLGFCSLNKVVYDKCSLGSEKLYLFDDIEMKELTEVSNFNFCYAEKYNIVGSNKWCGKLGFQLDNKPYKTYHYQNFINLLKKESKINSLTWYIHFNNKTNEKNNNINDGIIIFDFFDKNLEKDFPILNNYQMNTIKAKDVESILSWVVEFDKIFYYIDGQKFESYNLEAGFAFEKDFILCPQEYFNSIKMNFFYKFIQNKTCFVENGKYSYIYCDKNLFQTYINNFPPLNFVSLQMNKTFILEGNDLFKEYNNYILFTIFFQKYLIKYWVFGKIFMKKYNFFFDNDKKTIGYIEPLLINNEDINKFKDFFAKIKWYIIVFICGIGGFIIGKKLRDKARKIRANELEDNYEYLTNKAKEHKVNSQLYEQDIDKNK